jgi:hypothetical protein
VKVNRLELIESLRRAVAVIDNRSAVAILQYACFSEGAIQASNGETAIVTKAPRFGASFCIAGEWLLQLLAKLAGEEVDVSIDKDKLYVRSGRHESKTPTVDAKRFPDLLSSSKGATPLQTGPGLRRALEEVLELTSAPKQANLQGIGLWKNFVYATDGLRATRVSWDGHIPNQLVMPRDSAMLLLKHGDPRTLHLGNKDGCLLALYDGFVVIARLLEVKIPFVAIDQMVARAGNILELPEETAGAVDRVLLLGGEGGIAMSSKGGKLRISREKGGQSSAEEVLDVPGAPEFTFTARPEHLHVAVSRSRRCDLADVLNGQRRTLRFVVEDGAFELQHMMGLMV